MNSIKIVLIDDDLAIREIIRTYLSELEDKSGLNLRFYSSSNGVEGLGYVYVSNPDLLIIDTTLPKYSGKEVLDFLLSNKNFSNGVDVKVVVLTESNDTKLKNLPTNYTVLNKAERGFTQKLKEILTEKTGLKLTTKPTIKEKLADKAIMLANMANRTMRRINRSNILLKPILYVPWLFLQLILSMYLLGTKLTTKRVKDDNIEQEKKDLMSYRVKYYPTLITFMVAILTILLQVLLFVTGGVVIFNTRVESIFALGVNEQGYEFNIEQATNYEYDNTKIEIGDGGVMLKGTEQSIPTDPTIPVEPEPTPEEPEEEIPPVEEEIVPIETEEEPPVEEPAPEEGEEEVLGIETEQPVPDPTLEQTEILITYPTDKPSLVIKEGVAYTNLEEIIERSNINGDDTSTQTPEAYNALLDTLEVEDLRKQTKITYQLSPDKTNWYYYTAVEDRWSKTTQGAVSSNNIQDVNTHLTNYEETLGTGTLYLKIFLHSTNGQSTPILHEVAITKESGLVTDTGNLPKEPQMEEVVIENLDWEKIEPEIFNASFVNGEKVVKGKILLKNKRKKAVYKIIEEELSDYKAVITYKKGDPIGETALYINSRGEIEFLLRQPSGPGGYVQAQIVTQQKDSNLQPSELSKPVENSTFTVDSTGDTVDATPGDGLCEDAGSDCTLRAAIAEANALAGADNIYFSIPTSDAGYRDYDDPDTASSGDSLGGDDYWTIRPAINLPDITEEINIDGSTQTTNVADSNTVGPEIELDGRNTANGLVIDLAANNSTITSLNINRTGIGIYVYPDGFTLTKSYLGTDVRGQTAKANSIGLYLNVSDNTIIGNNTSDGNIFSGNSTWGAYFNCGTTGTAKTISFRGNKVGLGQDGTTLIENDGGLLLFRECDIEVGGDLEEHRNYLVGGDHVISVQDGSDGSNSSIEIYNNYIGTDATGTQTYQTGNTDYTIYISPGDFTHTHDPIIIGAENKGNLIRGGQNSIYYWDGRQAQIEYNTINPGSEYDESYGILVRGYIETDQMFDIKNNYISCLEDAVDPYFNVSMEGCSDTSYGIYTYDNKRGTTIKGNIINGFQNGIFLNGNETKRTVSLYTNRPQIGGTAAQTGSLCSDQEKNCIYGNTNAGVLLLGILPLNDDTLFTDNNYTNAQNPNNFNIAQLWSANFELFSGDVRRTDISDKTLDLEFIRDYNYSFNKHFSTGETITEDYVNQKVACLDPTHCPATGHSEGEAGQTMTLIPDFLLTEFPNSIPFNDMTNGSYALEYYYDNNGIKQNTGTIQFDEPHFSSKPFSFDGDATTHPIQSGTLRTINTEEYYDLGEPWTDNPDATRDHTIPDMALFQTAEVQFVDANPVLQNDGSYIITVDSTTDEDNVSSTGYDDGEGAYSGGGSEGVDGLADGKTSFREAIFVANNHSGADKIHFDIPTSDDGFINPDGSRTSTAEPAGTYTITPTGYWTIEDFTPSRYYLDSNDGITIDGYSQSGTSRNTASIGESFNAQLRIQINIYELKIISGTNIHITGLNLSGHDRAIYFDASSTVNGLWIEGNYLGTHIDGSNRLATDLSYSESGTIRSNNGLINDHIIGTNGDGNSDRGEFNIISGETFKEGAIVVFTSLYLNDGFRVSGNYLNVDYTGDLCSDLVGDRSAIQTGGTNNIMKNVIIGSNLDGVSDENESNVMGCIDTNYRGIIRVFSMDDAIVANNYIGISPNGADLRGGKPGANRTVSFTETNNIQFIGNIVNSYNATDYGSLWLMSTNYNDNLIIKNNQILGGTVAVGGVATNSIIENNTFDGYTDIGIMPNTGADDMTLRENVFSGAPGTRKVIHIGDFAAGDLSALVNDSSDTDTGPNDLQNYPVIEKVTYLSGGKYRLKGVLDGNHFEAPWEVEICESDSHSSGHGGCIDTLGFVTVKDNEDGPDHWQKTVIITGDDGTQERVFSTLATNSNGSTSEFSENFEGYTLATYPITQTYPIQSQKITDRAPLLDWNDNGDLDLDHYDVYLNHETSNNLVKIGSISDIDPDTGRIRTNFRISSELPLNYTDWYWKVVDVRTNGTIGGESEIEHFKVVENIEPLTLIYPTNKIEIDELRPLLQWTKTDKEDAKYYKIYLREVTEKETTPLISKKNLLATINDLSIEEYKLTPKQKLDYANYEWIVVAYYADGKVAGKSSKAEFSISKETSLPVTGEAQEIGDNVDEGEKQQTSYLWIYSLCVILVIILIIGGISVWKISIIRRRKKQS